MTYNNKDGEVIIKQADKETIITFVDYNEYIKCERALKAYLVRAYKQLVFKTTKELRKPREDGDYEIELYTDENFKKVYGSLKISFYVQNRVVVIKELTPKEILLNMYSVIPYTYKGVPYTNRRELFKIKMILGE